MAPPLKILTTTADVIKALGGISAVADLTGRRYSAACNWGGWGHFPPDTFWVMNDALAEAGYDAPRALWRQVEKPAERLSA